MKKSLLYALFIALGYAALFLLGQLVLPNSYLYGWLCSSRLFYVAAALSVLPSLWGKFRFSRCTLTGFALGLAAGTLWGAVPNSPYGAHYGWAIWGGAFLLSMAVGILAEIIAKKKKKRSN